jgi:hypothetical protein
MEQLRATLACAADGMSEEQLHWHPAGKWSAAEVLEHLYLSYTGTIKGFERVLDAGRPLSTKATLGQRVGTLAVLTLNYFPDGRQAPKATVPRGLPVEQVRIEVKSKIAAMDEILARCEERFRGVKLLDHPILGPLTAAQWRKFHFLHGRHHARQIARLRKQS